MRAWTSSAPGLAGLKLTQVNLPSPGPKEVLVSVEHAALNFSDLLMIEDRYQVRPDRPFVPGQEIAGTIVLAGQQSGFAAGDRIASKVLWGGFAEQAVVRSDMAIPIPEGITSAEAVTLPVVYTTAIVALTESTTVKPGEFVLVLAAAGGVGLAAVQIARHLGARVIAAAGGRDKCLLAREYGAHDTLDYTQDGWREAVMELTGGNGADVIVDPVGGAASKEALRTIAWGGRMLLVGFSSGEIPQIPANRLLLRRASAIGVYWNHDRDAAMLPRVSSRLTTMVQSGAIRPHVGQVFTFAQLPDALKALSERRINGKAILALNRNSE